MDLKSIITKNDLKEPYIFLIDFLELEEIFKIENLFNGHGIRFKKDFENTIEQQEELIKLIGREKAIKVAKILSKQDTYFSSIKRNCYDKVVDLIMQDFHNYSISELARKYGYSERQIYNIVGRKGKKRKLYVDETQITLFEESK